MTKLSSALPQGDGNGLAAIARALIDTPHEVHVVVALVDCKSSAIDHDSGEVVPTARVRRIEVVDDHDDKQIATQMMRRTLERRTGQVVLPLDLENDLKAAFGNVDPQTGEVLNDNDE